MINIFTGIAIVDNIITGIITILVFGLLIAIHELGHFIAAKKSGVKVNQFMIGMGPILWKKVKGDTEYSLRLLPIGGAVVMEGEDAYSKEEGSYGSAKAWKRAIIIVAGAIMNFVLGFLILVVLNIPGTSFVTTTLEGFQDEFDFESEAALMVGDKILEIDGYKILVSPDITMALDKYPAPHDILIERDGEKILIEDLPMERKEYTLEDGNTAMLYGFNLSVKEMNFTDKIEQAMMLTLNYARLVWVSLGDLISGNIGMEQMSGPVGVSTVIGQTAQDPIILWNLVALISINLGIMNLLPLPALDGGRLVFIIWEMIFKKPLNPKYEGYVHLVGFALLMMLMVFVTFNDIRNLFF